MDPNYLREATRAEHEATEAIMPLMDPGLTIAAYARVLASLWPIVESWESWAAANLPAGFSEFLLCRRRTPMLAMDLQSIGIAGVSHAVPAWASVVYAGDRVPDEAERTASILGGMYVMEGSTLGGRFIARYVEEHLGIVPGVGDAYFRGHGDATGSLWREFRDRLAAVPERFDPQVELAAKRTFQAFGRALRAGLDVHAGAS